MKYLTKKNPHTKACVYDALRNVSVDPDQAQNFCYVVGDFLVADLRLTFG